MQSHNPALLQSGHNLTIPSPFYVCQSKPQLGLMYRTVVICSTELQTSKRTNFQRQLHTSIWSGTSFAWPTLFSRRTPLTPLSAKAVSRLAALSTDKRNCNNCTLSLSLSRRHMRKSTVLGPLYGQWIKPLRVRCRIHKVDPKQKLNAKGNTYLPPLSDVLRHITSQRRASTILVEWTDVCMVA